MPTPEFQIFGTPHLVAMVLTLAVPILLIAAARKAGSKTVADAGAWLLAGSLLVNETIHWGYRLNAVGWSRFVQDHLPLHVCGLTILLTAATLIFRRQSIYEIVYFWGLVGSTNAVITPGDLEAGFPDYRFFQYFIAHSGIVAGVLYATLGLKMRPTLGGLFRAFVALNVLAVVLGVLNFLLESNYMFLSRPPAGTESPFFFAGWPWYIPIIDLVALAMFFVVLSPFLVARWKTSRTSTGPE
ncbi:MAG: TIGR02206 family membrane protein [Candidatus Aminicenantes bacterium]|nr:TIGR02206 family membrane protein [Candidatus Aminicenantes bacterium]